MRLKGKRKMFKQIYYDIKELKSLQAPTKKEREREERRREERGV